MRSARWLVGAGLMAVLLGVSPAQQTPPCTVAIINVSGVTVNVRIVHGEVAIEHPEPLLSDNYRWFPVPCGSTEPVQIMLTNTGNPEDFRFQEVPVPEPGHVTVWCVGGPCRQMAVPRKGGVG